MNNEHEKFMREAIKMANNGMQQNQGGPFGAVIVRDGEVIGRGCNQVPAAKDPTAHAEVNAIRHACSHLDNYSLKGCVIYTSCEPCPMCLSAIYWARLDAIYYADTRLDAAGGGFDDEFLYREVALPLGQRTIPMCHLPSQEALALFSDWNVKEDRIAY